MCNIANVGVINSVKSSLVSRHATCVGRNFPHTYNRWRSYMRFVHKYLHILLFIITLSSCSLSKEDAALKRKIEEKSPQKPIWVKTEEIKLEQPRGKDTAFLIHVQASRDYFFAKAQNNLLHVWARDGRYVGQAGTWGKGPGEYIEPWYLFFIDSKKVGVFDTARSVMNVYRIEKDKVVFMDQYSLDALKRTTPNEIKFDENYIYLNYIYGTFDNNARVVKVDKKALFENKPLKEGQTYFNLFPLKKDKGFMGIENIFCIGRDYLYFRDTMKPFTGKSGDGFNTPFIYQGTKDGKIRKRFNVGNGLGWFFLDNSKQVICVHTTQEKGLVEEKIYSLHSGKLLVTRIYSSGGFSLKNMNKGKFPSSETFTGEGNSTLIIAEPVDDGKTSTILHICEADLGLGEENEEE